MKTKDIIIEHFINNYGMITKKELHKKCNVKLSSLNIHLKELKDFGFISIVKNKYYIKNYNILRFNECDSCNKMSLLKRIDNDNIHYICIYCLKNKK